jgi:predicted regulator of Ras-like GTPase activity (Roadblock/LC7/MglB family)
MDDFDSGQWDALFAGDEDTRVVRAAGTASETFSVEEFCEVPGVKGAIRVALDGALQAHSLAESPEQAAAITTYLGASARQVGATMGYRNFDHAVLNFDSGGDPVLVFRQGSSFVGLLLEEDIAPSHIISRIRERSGGGE